MNEIMQMNPSNLTKWRNITVCALLAVSLLGVILWNMFDAVYGADGAVRKVQIRLEARGLRNALMTYAQDNDNLLPPNVGHENLKSAIDSLTFDRISQDYSSPWNRRTYVSRSLAARPSSELQNHKSPFLVTSGPRDDPFEFVYTTDSTDTPTLLTKEKAQTILDEYVR